jgi:hypothetical protein
MTKVNAPISELTERYDELVLLTKLKFDEDNIKLYGSDDKEYTDSLGDSIDEYGLTRPVVVYGDDKVKSGHTRIRVCIERGYTYIPVVRSSVKRPESSFRNMMALMMENQGRLSNLKRQFNQIETAISAYEKDNSKVCGKPMIQSQICPASQMSYNMYNQLMLV